MMKQLHTAFPQIKFPVYCLGLEKLLVLVPGVNSIPGILRLTGRQLDIDSEQADSKQIESEQMIVNRQIANRLIVNRQIENKQKINIRFFNNRIVYFSN